MSSPVVPIYYETSWSILSTIGLINVLMGFLVIGITSLSPITIVPIIVSSASAIADGLCYYAFYADYPIIPTAVAAGFADFFWLIQEAGLSFYSYQILIRILPKHERKIFMSIFWFFITAISSFKISILIARVLDILQNTTSRIPLIDHLHIGYFLGIAFNEGWCSYFLLKKFFHARRDVRTVDGEKGVGLFSYLTRSTEMRLTALTLIGVTRTITYSFQTTAQSATTASGQVDRFVTTLECLFPMIMYIDILAAKSIVRHDLQRSYNLSSRARPEPETKRGTIVGPQGAFPSAHIETWVDASGRDSSQEYIVQGHKTGRKSEDESMEVKGGISKTVEFEFHTTGGNGSDSPV